MYVVCYFWSVSTALHSLPEYELQEESRNLEEEQETAGNLDYTSTLLQPFHNSLADFWGYSLSMQVVVAAPFKVDDEVDEI